MILSKKPSFYSFYIVVLGLLAVSLPLSKFGMSVSQFLILILWFITGYKAAIPQRSCQGKGIGNAVGRFFLTMGRSIGAKFVLFWKNKAAVAFCSIFLLHAIGLLWTSDFEYGMKDLRIKLPLLMMPVVFVALPKIKEKHFYILMAFYVAANLGGSLFTFGAFLKGGYVDARLLSVFISPIRFSLNICLSIAFLAYVIYKPKILKLKYKLPLLALIAWFVVVLYLLESGVGFLSLGVIAVIFVAKEIQRVRFLSVKIALGLLIVGMGAFSINYLIGEYKSYNVPKEIDWNTLPVKTAAGTTYTHDTLFMEIENGNYPGMYLCEEEMRIEWNKRSSFRYGGKGKQGYSIRVTLIRYLNSKGLAKDAEGIKQLTAVDQERIERGIANHVYLDHPGVKARLYKFFFGYQRYKKSGDPSNSSLFQRIEYWAAAKNIIKKSPVIGVGTGDVYQSFMQEYKLMNSRLTEKFRLRAHNQYLAITVAFGLLGLIWFLFALFYSAYKGGGFKDLFFVCFFVIILLSMLTEDTLESQAGVTFFTFFYCFLLFSRKKTIVQQ